MAKKIARSLGRGEVGDAARLERNRTPKITLDHIIKERYPTFVDALRDLDDALSLLFLFANLPSISTVPPKTIALCQRLCLEFEHYLITTNSLRKSFLSIKGIYYQATIQGQDILWLVPYKFVQRVTGDVDFRIMGTFVEFYTTLLGFVNFRLYTSIGLVYPPKFDASSDERGGELGAITLEGRGIESAGLDNDLTNGHTNSTNGHVDEAEDLQKRIDSIGQLHDAEDDLGQQEQEVTERTNDAIDVFEPTGEGADVLLQPQISGTEASQLFAPFSFFLSRETPRQPLEFILRAFGCRRIAWDAVLGDGAFTHNEADPTITHQIVDRPPLPSSSVLDKLPEDDKGTDSVAAQTVKSGSRILGRTYVQPQWVWDCINEGKLLRPDLYASGATLPPHLSPWVKPTKGAYDPSLPLVEQEREGEAEEAEESEDGIEVEEEMNRAENDQDEEASLTVAEETPTTVNTTLLLAKSLADDENDMDVANSDENDEKVDKSSGDDFSGFDDDEVGSEDEAETARTQHQKELEAEALGLTYLEAGSGNGAPLKGILKKSSGQEARKKAVKKRKEEEEELERRKMMMGRKKRKMLDKMLYSNCVKDDAAEKLRSKRRKIEKVRS